MTKDECARGQGFSTLALLTLGAGNCYGDRPVHCSLFRSSPALLLRCQKHSPPSCEDQNMSSDIIKHPLGGTIALVTALDRGSAPRNMTQDSW